jgi:hypothetical protein
MRTLVEEISAAEVTMEVNAITCAASQFIAETLSVFII